MSSPTEKTDLSRAFELLSQSRFQDALHVLEGKQSGEAALLKARLFYRTAQYDQALESLINADDSFKTRQLRSYANVLLAFLYQVFEDERAAQQAIDAVDLAVLKASASQEHVANNGVFLYAIYHLKLGEVDKARAAALDCDYGDNVSGFMASRNVVMFLEKTPRGRADRIIEALRAGAKAKDIDVGVMAGLLVELAIANAYVLSDKIRALLATLEKRLTWNDDLAMRRAILFRESARERAVRTDFAAAYNDVRSAIDILTTKRAPTDDGHITLLQLRLIRAWIARLAGEVFSSSGELLATKELLEELNVRDPHKLEFECLLFAAELFADEEPEHARALLAAYDRAKARLAPVNYWLGGEVPLRLYTLAKLEYADGKMKLAEAYVEEAVATADATGHDWVAAMAVLLQYHISRDAKQAQDFRKRVAALGHTFLTRELEKLPPPAHDAEILRLTPKQREVFGLLKEGLSASEIGKKLRTSPNTVRIHIGKIYAAFGVSSRSEFAAKSHFFDTSN